VTETAKDLTELAFRGNFDSDLGLDSPKESRIDKLRRIQVGCEDDKQLERNFDLSPPCQRQEINLAIKRNHPAIE